MEIVFKLLCGLLYAIGLAFGWTYEEVSVNICIYACPVICCLMALLGAVHCSSKTFFCRILKSINIALLIFYVNCTNMFWHHYAVQDPFQLCVKDITEIASHMGITYAEANIEIYCYLFFGIIAFHIITLIIDNLLTKRYEETPDNFGSHTHECNANVRCYENQHS